MKKRVKTSNNNPFYSNEPAVSRTKIADRGMTQNASLGNAPPKIVDKKPGRISGVAGFADKKRPPAKGIQNPPMTSQLKTGTAKSTRFPTQGRPSGNPKAHRIGGFKMKV